MILYSIMMPIDPSNEEKSIPTEKISIKNGIPNVYQVTPYKDLYNIGQIKLRFSTSPSDWLEEKYGFLPDDILFK